MPDFYQGKQWVEIEKKDISEDQIVPVAAYDNLLQRPIRGQSSRKQRLDIQLLKKEKDVYYRSLVCLTEYFALADYSSIFNTPAHVINTGQTPLTVKQMKTIFERNFPDVDYIMTSKFSKNFPNFMLPAEGDACIRMYLSQILTIKNQQAYQFWTYAPWDVSDGPNIQRGIDRFIYVPKKGIIAGSYDFYFDFHNPWKTQHRQKQHKLSNEQWINNILNEKVMIAEEWKGDRSA